MAVTGQKLGLTPDIDKDLVAFLHMCSPTLTLNPRFVFVIFVLIHLFSSFYFYSCVFPFFLSLARYTWDVETNKQLEQQFDVKLHLTLMNSTITEFNSGVRPRRHGKRICRCKMQGNLGFDSVQFMDTYNPGEREGGGQKKKKKLERESSVTHSSPGFPLSFRFVSFLLPRQTNRFCCREFEDLLFHYLLVSAFGEFGQFFCPSNGNIDDAVWLSNNQNRTKLSPNPPVNGYCARDYITI